MRIIHSDQHRLHDPSGYISRGRIVPSAECPERAKRLLSGLARAGYVSTGPDDHGMAPLTAVHSAEYLDFLRTGHAAWAALPGATAEMIPNAHPGRNVLTRPEGVVGLAGYHMADTACPIGAGTWDAAYAGAQVALTAADAVIAGASAAYALCRPPGHHAYGDMAGGFCFLNNVAIAAEYLRRHHDRVAILDVDVHHGNGTQGIFYDRADVLFASIHADPANFYPFFSGYAHERGDSDGLGCNLNLPLAPGGGDDVFLAALEEALGAARRFTPSVLLVSLGLDAQENDPLGVLNVTTEGFGRIGGEISRLGLPTLIVQEGGYLCPELADNLVGFLTGFEGARE
jgi:acetoin utilization deacetylase AcuC-like enzyme